MRVEIDEQTGQKWIGLDKEEVKMGFLAQCVESIAEAFGCDYVEMFNRLERADMTEGFILKYYEPLHIQSWDHVIRDLKEMLISRESE